MILFIVLFSGCVLIALTLYFLFRKHKSRSEIVEPQIDIEDPEQRANQIVIGQDASNPIITIECLDSDVEFKRALPLDLPNGAIGWFAGILQAAPSLLVATQASGKQLMEVVIKGEFVQAADGNGLRAFAIGRRGVTEHARLFEVDNLQNVINAAALWQVASVLVAQKHLADIGRKLDEIRDNLQAISKFLNDQRKSRIVSTYEYLEQCCRALRAGEQSGAVRNQLENCERDLLEIQQHIEMEYWQTLKKRVEHKEVFGTSDLTDDIGNKIDNLEELAHEAALCLKTRIATWHVFSLYPGEPELKAVRRSKIEESLNSFESLQNSEQLIQEEIEGIRSWLNRATTLEQRKSMLLEKCHASTASTVAKSGEIRNMIESSNRLMQSNARAVRIIVQLNDGGVIEARQRP